jgi:predicted CopG family antitoxin
MRQIEVSEETFRALVRLKNHWSFQYREVTNPEVLKLLDGLKREIFGYGSSASAEEIERISNQKSRDRLEAEMEDFSKALNELLTSGYDFEPGYTLDDHINRMIQVLEDSGAGAAPIF